MHLFTLKTAGVKRFDIMPYIVGKGNPRCDEGLDYYERTYYVHRNIGPDNKAYVCPAKTIGQRCPICEWRLRADRNKTADEALIKDLAPRERQLFVVYDHADSDKGYQVWDISYHLFGKALDKRLADLFADGDDYYCFADLQGGYTLRCGIVEKTIPGRTFFEVGTIDFKARAEDFDPECLQDTPCLDDLLVILPYDELRAIFLQSDEPDVDNIEDAPTNRPAGPRKGNRPGKTSPPPTDDTDGNGDEHDPTDDTGGDDGDGPDNGGEEAPPPKRPGNRPGNRSGNRPSGPQSSRPSSSKSGGGKPTAAGKKPSNQGGKTRCPGGGTFGEDTDTLDACDKCSVWAECDEAKHPRPE
jgi:hypothetical protein